MLGLASFSGPVIAKSTSVTRAFRPSAALFSFATLISTVPGELRTEGSTRRATVSFAARTSHHGDELHFECKIFHSGANSCPTPQVAPLIRWSHEPVPRFTCPDIGG